MKKRVYITGVGVRDGVALITGTVVDSLIHYLHHELRVRLEINDELTLEKITEEFTRLEIERISDLDNKIGEELGDKFLGKDFEIELPEDEST